MATTGMIRQYRQGAFYHAQCRACLDNAIHDPGLTPATVWLDLATEWAIRWQRATQGESQ